MRTFVGFCRIAGLAVLLLLGGCDEEDPSETYVHDDTSNYYGDWKRSNMETYVRISGSTAITCSNGQETTGTFNSSEPSMTYVINGDVIKFPLQFNGDTMLVGVPDQAIDTHNAQVYNRSSNYGCGGSTGGGGDGNVTFWAGSDLGCGTITVTFRGTNGYMTHYFSSSPGCDAYGCANFSAPAGTYSYTASCSEYNWSGSVTVNSGGCSTMKLTL